MINWKTILSSFNDKPTLMQWLKIVKKALENASLESVTAKTAPNNAVAFEFKFADGSTVTSTAANLEAKGISGIEEVSDEVVGNQTLTTLRAYYTDGTTDEIPVYAENGSKLYYHRVRLNPSTDAEGVTVNILSPLATELTFDYLYNNYLDIVLIPRFLSKTTDAGTDTFIIAQFAREAATHTLAVRRWNLTKNISADIANLTKVANDTVFDLK